MVKTTQINFKTVGSGHWKFSSIRNYCQKKNVALVQAAHVSYDINYGFDYDHLNIENGEVVSTSNSDMMARMLG